MTRLSAVPTVSELRAFEAAARLRSISGAATELRCSQPCITHRIRSLERRWTTELLSRTTRTVDWTPATIRAYEKVRVLLRDLELLVEEFAPSADAQQLMITVSSAFASAWLIPRLPTFRALHPSIEVRLSATNRYVDLAAEGFDIGIRLLPLDAAPAPDHQSAALTDARLIPVAGAGLAARTGRDWTLADLADAHLIWMDGSDDWPAFFRTYLPTCNPPSPGSIFNNADLVIKAATENHGVALARAFLVTDDLRSGRLVALFDLSIASGDTYHFVSPRPRFNRPAVRQFRSWLVDTIERDRAVWPSPPAVTP